MSLVNRPRPPLHAGTDTFIIITQKRQSCRSKKRDPHRNPQETGQLPPTTTSKPRRPPSHTAKNRPKNRLTVHSCPPPSSLPLAASYKPSKIGPPVHRWPPLFSRPPDFPYNAPVVALSQTRGRRSSSLDPSPLAVETRGKPGREFTASPPFPPPPGAYKAPESGPAVHRWIPPSSPQPCSSCSAPVFANRQKTGPTVHLWSPTPLARRAPRSYFRRRRAHQVEPGREFSAGPRPSSPTRSAPYKTTISRGLFRGLLRDNSAAIPSPLGAK